MTMPQADRDSLFHIVLDDSPHGFTLIHAALIHSADDFLHARAKLPHSRAAAISAAASSAGRE